MPLWTETEIRELITLWRRIRRCRSQCACAARARLAGKVKRLRQEGALPPRADKHFDVIPVQARPKRPSPETPATAAKPALVGTVPHLEVSP